MSEEAPVINNSVTVADEIKLTVEEQVSFVKAHIEKIENVTQYTVKKIRQLLLDQGIINSHISKEAIIQAVSSFNPPPPPVNSEEHNNYNNEENDDSESSDSDSNSDGEFPADLSPTWKEKFGSVVWVYSYKLWYDILF